MYEDKIPLLEYFHTGALSARDNMHMRGQLSSSRWRLHTETETLQAAAMAAEAEHQLDNIAVSYQSRPRP
ncbi:unnamed protein product [Boreogadus saida]